LIDQCLIQASLCLLQIFTRFGKVLKIVTFTKNSEYNLQRIAIRKSIKCQRKNEQESKCVRCFGIETGESRRSIRVTTIGGREGAIAIRDRPHLGIDFGASHDPNSGKPRRLANAILRRHADFCLRVCSRRQVSAPRGES